MMGAEVHSAALRWLRVRRCNPALKVLDPLDEVSRVSLELVNSLSGSFGGEVEQSFEMGIGGIDLGVDACVHLCVSLDSLSGDLAQRLDGLLKGAVASLKFVHLLLENDVIPSPNGLGVWRLDGSLC